MYSTSFYNTPLCSTLHSSILLYPDPLQSTLLRSSPLRSTPLHHTTPRFYSNLVHSTLLYSALLCSTLPNSTPFHSIPLHPTPLCPAQRFRSFLIPIQRSLRNGRQMSLNKDQNLLQNGPQIDPVGVPNRPFWGPKMSFWRL